MGCSSSVIDNEAPFTTRVSILDSTFMKSQNDSIRQKMKQMQIDYQVYFSIDALIKQMMRVYTNEIITNQQSVTDLVNQLNSSNFLPNVYVCYSKEKTVDEAKQFQEKFSKDKNVHFYQNYDTILQYFSCKQQRHSKRILTNSKFKPKSLQKNSLKIFQNFDQSSSQLMIFEQTLKSRGLSYEKYGTFNDLEQSMVVLHSKFIVTDYVYHRSVLNLVEKYGSTNNQPSRVICYCQAKSDEKYDQRLYFVTNNLLEIVKEVQSEEKLKNLTWVKCSKIFVYMKEDNYLLECINLIQNFQFEIKITSSLEKILKETKYYFSLTIIINPEDRKEVQRYLESNDYLFKTKIVEISKSTPNSIIGLRKIIKELKKGYKTQKSLTRSIDIIDKHFNNTKFDSIKKQLEKNNIKLYGYPNFSTYIKKQKFISPFIISNFQQKSLLVRYLNEVQYKSKIIIFCNKNFINQNESILKNKKFSFVSHHFGKIIKFIKKNHVFNPYIVDENDNKIKEKKENLKNKNKRISALKWGGIKQSQTQQISALEKDFEFININSSTNQSNIREIQKDSAELFKLDYLPSTNKSKFKTDLCESFRKLSNIFKINYPEGEFQKLLNQINEMNLQGLLKKARQFFTSQNELGVKLNKSLIDVSALTKQEILAMKQLMYLINLNYLPVYSIKYIHKVKLYHYLQSQIILNCQIGSYLLNKNYQVFYEDQGEIELSAGEQIAKYRIELELQFNTLGQNDLEINPFFNLNKKYIFPPLSQFLIKQITKIGDINVITLQFKKNIDFLKAYFDDNLLKKQSNVLTVYQKQINEYSKQNSASSLLIDEDSVEKIKLNINRIQALRSFKINQFDQAIQLQKKIILQEQNLQNFDSSKLQSLNYQLACFYFKANKHEECKKLVKQLLDSQPVQFLKQKIKLIAGFYEQSKEKGDNNEDKMCQSILTLRNEQILKIITLDEDIDCNQTQERQQSLSQISKEQANENVFDSVSHKHEFSFIQMQRIEDFEQMDKQNIQ